MCDKGMLESNPDLCKLEYCIAINEKLQQKIVKGINKLLEPLEETCFMSNPLPGKFPEENPEGRNTVQIRSNALYSEKYPDIYRTICWFSLRELPGCCGILVSYHMYVEKRYQGLGIANFLQEIKEDIARENGYTTMMCTTLDDNHVENHILEKFGWEKQRNFINKRTTNNVIIWTKEIEYETN